MRPGSLAQQAAHIRAAPSLPCSAIQLARLAWVSLKPEALLPLHSLQSEPEWQRLAAVLGTAEVRAPAESAMNSAALPLPGRTRRPGPELTLPLALASVPRPVEFTSQPLLCALRRPASMQGGLLPRQDWDSLDRHWLSPVSRGSQLQEFALEGPVDVFLTQPTALQVGRRGWVGWVLVGRKVRGCHEPMLPSSRCCHSARVMMLAHWPTPLPHPRRAAVPAARQRCWHCEAHPAEGGCRGDGAGRALSAPASRPRLASHRPLGVCRCVGASMGRGAQQPICIAALPPRASHACLCFACTAFLCSPPWARQHLSAPPPPDLAATLQAS